jgi:hypothetical protein
MSGSNQQGRAGGSARLFRPEQTRALLVGGVRCAQLVALRGDGPGRPRGGADGTPAGLGAVRPGSGGARRGHRGHPARPVGGDPAGSALHPLLVVVDIGPVGADNRPGAGWQATLVVRTISARPTRTWRRGRTLLLVQPLRAGGGDPGGRGAGLGETAKWLTQIRADMVGVINRRAVRWAALSQTPIEGPTDRSHRVRG